MWLFIHGTPSGIKLQSKPILIGSWTLINYREVVVSRQTEIPQKMENDSIL